MIEKGEVGIRVIVKPSLLVRNRNNIVPAKYTCFFLHPLIELLRIESLLSRHSRYFAACY